MTFIYTPNYQIAAGNDNAAGLFSLEGTIPAGDEPFRAINAYGTGNPGEARTRGDGSLFFSGFPSFQWVINVVSRGQDYYLRNDILGDPEAWSGPVTVRTDLWQPETFANYNAILRIVKLSDLNRRWHYFTDYVLAFVRVVAI